MKLLAIQAAIRSCRARPSSKVSLLRHVRTAASCSCPDSRSLALCRRPLGRSRSRRVLEGGLALEAVHMGEFLSFRVGNSSEIQHWSSSSSSLLLLLLLLGVICAIPLTPNDVITTTSRIHRCASLRVALRARSVASRIQKSQKVQELGYVRVYPSIIPSGAVMPYRITSLERLIAICCSDA